MSKPPQKAFRKIFVENVRVRSRSAGGRYDRTASDLKAPALALVGQDLATAVLTNAATVADAVWEAADDTFVTGDVIADLVEEWERLINAGLCPLDKSRLRTWTVDYSGYAPDEIPLALDCFYARLADMISAAKGGAVKSAEVLAFADYMMDGEIHPWADGCGRVATALVMWLTLVLGLGTPPRFPSRKQHYAALEALDLGAHVSYFEARLQPGGGHAPWRG